MTFTATSTLSNTTMKGSYQILEVSGNSHATPALTRYTTAMTTRRYDQPFPCARTLSNTSAYFCRNCVMDFVIQSIKIYSQHLVSINCAYLLGLCQNTHAMKR